ncbi:MAG: MFS transporter [Rhodoferax sp.]|nr:MFS transporter [Rhodoferax sp.]MCB2006031.1 MFS transporter [Rhodoferax sp.]MCB2027275.1 MFS transporter [Rhodoferax sp.]
MSAVDPPPMLRDPQLRRLWAVGMLMSLIRWLEILAFAVFTYEHTRSALWVANLMMLRLLPLSLFGLALGALAARRSRRTVLIVTHAMLLGASCLLLILSVSGVLVVWHLALASFINGVVWAGDMPMRRSLMGDIAGHTRLVRAMSLDAVASNACRLIGPGLGGLLLARGGLTAVLAVTTLFYLPVLVALTGLSRQPVAADLARPSLRGLLVRGLQAVRASPALRAVMWITIVFNLFGWPVLSMVPVIGQVRLHLDAPGVGLLASVDGVGSLLGALVLTSIAGRLRQGPLYLGAVLLFLALQIVFGWSADLWLTVAVLLVIGLAQAGFAVMQATLVYVAAPADRRPEALGLITMCIGVAPLGFLLTGWLAEHLGASTAAMVTGACGLVAVGLTWPLCRGCFPATTDTARP